MTKASDIDMLKVLDGWLGFCIDEDGRCEICLIEQHSIRLTRKQFGKLISDLTELWDKMDA